MRKIKKLEQRIEYLENSLNEIIMDYNSYKVNISTREYLLKTNFTGNIKTEHFKNRLRYDIYTINGVEYSFNDIVNEISYYNFNSIGDLMIKIAELEQAEAKAQQHYVNIQENNAENCNISGMTVNVNVKTNKKINKKPKEPIEQVVKEVEKVEEKEEPKTIANFKKAESESTTASTISTYNAQKRGKMSSLDKYEMANPNDYYVKNLDSYFINISKCRYPLTKKQVATLVNLIYKEKTADKIAEKLGVRASTISTYLNTLGSLGIAKEVNGSIELDKGLLLSKTFRSTGA